MKHFRFSDTSISKLETVDQALMMLMEEALWRSPIDFAITCGYRSPADQLRMYYDGKTKLRFGSQHEKRLAVDIAPIYKGKARWRKKYFLPIVEAVALSTKNIASEHWTVQWGGWWSYFFLDDMRSDLLSHDIDIEKAWTKFNRQTGQGKFIDMPHFQLKPRV